MKKVLLALVVGSFIMGCAGSIFADDGEKGSMKGSMKGSDHDQLMKTQKGAMQAAMVEHIESKSVADIFMLEDKRIGKTRNLSYEGLHEGIGMKNDKHYSCADFKDFDTGEMLDVDIFVDVTDDGFEVTDTVIHKIDGKKIGEAKAEMKGSDDGDKGSMKGSDHDDKGSMKGSGY